MLGGKEEKGMRGQRVNGKGGEKKRHIGLKEKGGWIIISLFRLENKS